MLTDNGVMAEPTGAGEALPENSIRTLFETLPTLETIEEARENSSLSGESTDNFADENDNVSLTTPKSPKKEDFVPYNKVKWKFEDDDDDIQIDENDNNKNFPQDQIFTHPNVDRGWAWVVLIAIFCTFTINSGLLSSTALYYAQMLEEFKRSRSYTAWLGSLMNAFFMLAGPLVSVVIKRSGCRVSIISGGIIMTAGYLLSALANSLPIMFLTYGVIVATGMNFVYSGQIITLAQYFCRRHSFATSASMMGVGIGIFVVVRLVDYAIIQYGWRTSFILCAALSLQLCVFGAVVFPLQFKAASSQQISSDGKRSVDVQPSHCSPNLVRNDLIMNRSVSSLKLSIGAGYLSSSIQNLDIDNKSSFGHFGSNQHSFCSRGSQYIGGMRSNQESFSQFGGIDFHHSGVLSFIRSNQHSFGSRSSFGIHSIKSSTPSFHKNSQADLQHLTPHHHQHVNNNSNFKTTNDAQPSEDAENSDEDSSKEKNVPKHSLLTLKLLEILKKSCSNCRCDLFLNPCFWCVNIAMFFTMLASIKLFIIYKDMSAALNVVEFYHHAMSAQGVGDILGRMSVGVITSYQTSSSVLIYSCTIFLTGIVIVCHLLATYGPVFVLISGLFGFLYGQQCVLITLIPSIIFGKDLLLTVFGYVLFTSGLGALVGAPLAGYIVDRTGSYDNVLLLSFVSCVIASISLLCCFIIKRKQDKKQQLMFHSSNSIAYA